MAANQQALMMAGTTAVRSAVVNNATYSRSGSSPTGLDFRADGAVWAKDDTSGGTYTSRYNWKTGTGATSDYELRVTLDGGSPDGFSSGTVGSWLGLGTTRSYTRGSSSWIERTVTALFEIRDASTLVVLASGTISLTCDYGTGTPP